MPKSNPRGGRKKITPISEVPQPVTTETRVIA